MAPLPEAMEHVSQVDPRSIGSLLADTAQKQAMKKIKEYFTPARLFLWIGIPVIFLVIFWGVAFWGFFYLLKRKLFKEIEMRYYLQARTAQGTFMASSSDVTVTDARASSTYSSDTTASANPYAAAAERFDSAPSGELVPPPKSGYYSP